AQSGGRNDQASCPLSRNCPVTSAAPLLKSRCEIGAIFLSGPSSGRHAYLFAVLRCKFSLVNPVPIWSPGNLRNRARLGILSTRSFTLGHRNRSQEQCNYGDGNDLLHGLLLVEFQTRPAIAGLIYTGVGSP